MRKYSTFILALAIGISLVACQNVALSSSVELKSDSSEAMINNAVIKALSDEESYKLDPRFAIENQRPFIVWNELPGAEQYKVIIKRKTPNKSSTKITKDTRIDVFPGEEVAYQLIPLAHGGQEMTEYASELLDVEYIVKGKLGGVKAWLRPDFNYSYRSTNEFPEGLYWSGDLADEILAWLNKTYSTEYLLSGHIAEIDPSSKKWLAPMTPADRRQGEWEGNGLDCVGFVNGFYYLYTQALAGENYTNLDHDMSKSYGVYACPTAPTATLGYYSHIVLKPSLAGGFADESHIRPGDMIMSRDHSWIVSDEGSGLKSKIWEYEEMYGFSRHRTLESIQKHHPDNPHDYWITTIANPLESYGKIKILAVNQAGEAVSGGDYVLKDTYERTLALEDKGSFVELYRPDGDGFFKKIFTMDETDEFYDDEAKFSLLNHETTLHRVIGGKYILEEIQTPYGYKALQSVSIDISPGEEKVVRLVYTKNLLEPVSTPGKTAH